MVTGFELKTRSLVDGAHGESMDFGFLLHSKDGTPKDGSSGVLYRTMNIQTALLMLKWFRLLGNVCAAGESSFNSS